MTIGNDILPGIISDIESIPTVRVSSISNANVLVIGSGNTTEGEAEPNQAYTITRPTVPGRLFGADSELTGQVMDALGEGAMPVYAVMADRIEQTETLESIGSTSGTLENVPVVEDSTATTFTVDSTDLETTLVYGDVTTETPETGEAILNPVTGNFELPETPTAGDVVYESVDYSGAMAALDDETVTAIDAVGVVSENDEVKNTLEVALNDMENFHQFAVGVVGSGATIDTASYENTFDNSRIAEIYPLRNDEWKSAVGSVLGVIGDLGLNGSVMNKRLSRHTRMSDRLDRTEQADLVQSNVIPIASESLGALIVDDITSVKEENVDEQKMDTIFNRIVMDYVTTIVRVEEQPFIGRLNKQTNRASLQGNISERLSTLEDNDSILDYNIEVIGRDADSAFVDVSVETVEPLRNIYNKIAAGQIN